MLELRGGGASSGVALFPLELRLPHIKDVWLFNTFTVFCCC